MLKFPATGKIRRKERFHFLKKWEPGLAVVYVVIISCVGVVFCAKMLFFGSCFVVEVNGESEGEHQAANEVFDSLHSPVNKQANAFFFQFESILPPVTGKAATIGLHLQYMIDSGLSFPYRPDIPLQYRCIPLSNRRNPAGAHMLFSAV